MVLKWGQSGGDASGMIKSTEDNKKLTAEKEAQVNEARAELFAKLETIGNLVHDTVPVSDDEVRHSEPFTTCSCNKASFVCLFPFATSYFLALWKCCIFLPFLLRQTMRLFVLGVRNEQKPV